MDDLGVGGSVKKSKTKHVLTTWTTHMKKPAPVCWLNCIGPGWRGKWGFKWGYNGVEMGL